MIDFESKYTGAEVEALLDSVSGKQDLINDLDAIREGASKGATALQSIPSEYVTESDLNNKVDKVDGKGLSTEDFTSALKSKLEGLSNYNDTEIANAVSSLQTQINTLVNDNPSDAINSFNEIIAFLAGVKDSEDLDNIIASIEQQIAKKQDIISDLATIRTNASKGATAVQPSSLASVATSGDYNDLNNKPTIPARLSQLTNDKGFITTNDVKASVWECPLEGEIGGVLFETGDQDTIELLSEWIGELNNQRPCVLMYDEPYGYAFVQDFKHHVTYGSNMCRFSYVYNGYIYEVEYDKVNLPVTFTIVNKLKLSDTHKQDKLVSGTNIKKINNQSILGSGNINIDTGITNLGFEVDTLEGEVGDALISVDRQEVDEDFTGFVEDFMLSDVLNYIYIDDEPKGLAYITSWWTDYTVYRFGYIYNGYIYEIEFRDDQWVEFKIINKLKLSNNEGGGSSSGGEDIRYFTEFTVESFISACNNSTSISLNNSIALKNAIANGKLICVPYNDEREGFLTARCYSIDDNYYLFSLEYGGLDYSARLDIPHLIPSKIKTLDSSITIYNDSNNAYVSVIDSVTYIISNPVQYLSIDLSTDLNIGACVRFKSADNCSIEIYEPLWPNGSVPTIEANTWYELSITATQDEILAVLTSFKSVES